MTTTQTQIRRDTATNLNASTPADGELGYDTTNKRLVIGDGATAGGIKIPTAKDQQNQAFLYPAVSGTGDAIILTNTVPKAALTGGQKGTFKAGANNTMAVQINEDGRGLKDVKKMNNGALASLVANDIVSGGLYDYLYDGTQYQIKGLAEGPFSAGAFKFLGSATASNSATIDLTSLLSSTYDDYQIILDNIILSSTGSLLMRCSPDNSTFDAGTTYAYSLSETTSASSAASISKSAFDTAFKIMGPSSVSSFVGLSGQIDLLGVNSTATYRGVIADTVSFNGTDFVQGRFGGFWQNNTNTLEAVRFLSSTVNIASGTFKIYGKSKT